MEMQMNWWCCYSGGGYFFPRSTHLDGFMNLFQFLSDDVRWLLCRKTEQTRMSECKIKILGVSEKERDSALWDEILQFVGVWQFRRSIVLRPRELCERIREMAKIHFHSSMRLWRILQKC